MSGSDEENSRSIFKAAHRSGLSTEATINSAKASLTAGFGYDDLKTRVEKLQRTAVFRGTSSQFAWSVNSEDLPENVRQSLSKAEAAGSDLLAEKKRF